MAFQRSKVVKSAKPDKPGRVAVRILLVDTQRKGVEGTIVPTPGNLRRDLFIEGTTVGEVTEAIEQALFGNNQEPD